MYGFSYSLFESHWNHDLSYLFVMQVSPSIILLSLLRGHPERSYLIAAQQLPILEMQAKKFGNLFRSHLTMKDQSTA